MAELTLKQTIDIAKRDPEFANKLAEDMATGIFDDIALNEGVDISAFSPSYAQKRGNIGTGFEFNNTMEKVADFTGGKEIAQGLGQALTQKQSSKMIEEQQAQQFDLQGRLLDRIKTAKAEGRDTSRLEAALADLTETTQEFGQGAEQVLNPNELTGREVIGDALQLGTTIVGAGQLPGVAQSATQATSFTKGAIEGAKLGAKTGLGYGAVSGLAQGLQDTEQGVGDVLKTTAGGAVTGAVTGGLIGGLVGGISGAVKGKSIANKAGATTDDVLEAVTPDAPEVGSKEYKQLLDRGQIKPKTAKSPAQIMLSENDKATAIKYKDIITKDPVQTGINIREQIAYEDELVGKFLKENNGIFNTGELKNKLIAGMDDVVDLQVDEKQLNRAKTKLVDSFLKDLNKNDMESLWKLRKQYDSQIDRVFGKTNPTLNDQVKRSLRNTVQDFISERTKDEVYKTSMREMSNLYKLKDLVDNKAIKQKNYSSLNLWAKKNPRKAKAIGGAATALAGAKLLGVGPFD